MASWRWWKWHWDYLNVMYTLWRSKFVFIFDHLQLQNQSSRRLRFIWDVPPQGSFVKLPDEKMNNVKYREVSMSQYLLVFNLWKRKKKEKTTTSILYEIISVNGFFLLMVIYFVVTPLPMTHLLHSNIPFRLSKASSKVGDDLDSEYTNITNKTKKIW